MRRLGDLLCIKFTTIYITGLLTVDPSERLKISDLRENMWVKGSSVPTTPLLSPKVLSPGPRLPTSFNATMKAFHMATKEGFQLSAVNNAPLAQRRNKKRARKRSASTSSDARSSSVSSTGSVSMTSASTSVTSACSTPTTPTVDLSEVEIPTSPCENVEVISSPSSKRPRLSLSDDFSVFSGSSSAWDSNKQPTVVELNDSIHAADCSALANNLGTFDRSSSDCPGKISRESSRAESGYATNTGSDSSPPFGLLTVHSRTDCIKDASL